LGVIVFLVEVFQGVPDNPEQPGYERFGHSTGWGQALGKLPAGNLKFLAG
jgi:hypothetical protein